MRLFRKTSNRNPNPNRSLSSKYREFCAAHNLPTIALPIAIFIVLATVMLVIGGTLAGWDIWGGLSSKTAILVYFLIVTAVVILLVNTWRKR